MVFCHCFCFYTIFTPILPPIYSEKKSLTFTLVRLLSFYSLLLCSLFRSEMRSDCSVRCCRRSEMIFSCSVASFSEGVHLCSILWKCVNQLLQICNRHLFYSIVYNDPQAISSVYIPTTHGDVTAIENLYIISDFHT